jgi:glycosyltransferase involved in cell wall biosynthesis
MKIFSAVIPVYQNEGSLAETHKQLHDLFLNNFDSKFVLEIIFVNDGSTDNSLTELKKLKTNDQHLKIVNLTRNFGQANALSAGYKVSSGEMVLTISADLQDPIDLIPKMIYQLEHGSDVVICHRIARNDDFFSKLFSKIAYKIIRFSVPQIPSGGFDFVLMSRRAINVVIEYGGKARFLQADMLWAGYPISLIPYERNRRVVGKSQYNFMKKLKIFLDAVLDTSYLPIRVVSSFGIVISLLGFFYSIIVIVSWLLHKTPFPGYAPIIISIFLIGGLNIILLGLIGEYIWRIYDEVRKRPNYLIDKIID